jgi:hypothetical protein
LKTEGISLKRANKSEYLELLDYHIVLENQVFYENRFQYGDLIKKYIDGEINCYAFQWDFFDLYYEHLEISDNLRRNLNQSSSITFSIDSKMKNFCSLMEDLVPLCEFLDEGVTEERFDREIKKIYSDMQKYAPSTSAIYNDFEVLGFTMIFFTVVTTIAYCFLKPEVYSLLTNIFS